MLQNLIIFFICKFLIWVSKCFICVTAIFCVGIFPFKMLTQNFICPVIFFFFWKIDILNSFIIVFIFSLNSLHEVYIGITNCKCLFSQMSILKMLMFWVNHLPLLFFFFFTLCNYSKKPKIRKSLFRIIGHCEEIS